MPTFLLYMYMTAILITEIFWVKHVQPAESSLQAGSLMQVSLMQ